MESLKNKNRLGKIVSAAIAVLVAITPQIIEQIPKEYGVLAAAVVIAIVEFLDQYSTEKRVIRAEDLIKQEPTDDEGVV